MPADLTAQSRRPRAQPPKPQPTGPLTLEEVIKVIEYVRAGSIKESFLIERLEARGVDFARTPENEARLREKGASDAVMERVAKLAKAPPAPPPPKKGSFQIVCAPAECDIAVNGQARGATQNGRMRVADHALGRVVVHATRAGYIGDERIITLGAEAQPDVVFKLSPSNMIRAAFGKKLFDRMMNAIASPLRPDMLRQIEAEGAASIWYRGSLIEGNFVAEFAPPSLAELEMSLPAGVFTLQCRGLTNCRAKSGGKSRFAGKKRMKPEEAGEVDTTLRLFRRYHFYAMLERLMGSDLRPVADSEETSLLRLETADEAFVITLNSDGLPGMVAYESKLGLGSGTQMTYGDYAAVPGSAKYPRRTGIKLPGTQQGGIQARFERFSRAADLKEKDFPK